MTARAWPDAPAGGALAAAGAAIPAAALDLLRAFVATDGASAAALALVRPGGEIGLATVGHAARWRQGPDGALLPAPGAPIGLDSRFDLASLTKPVATLGLVLGLLADGRLGLDAPVGEVLPDARDGAMASVTLAQLLGHASGWPAWRDFAAEVGLAEPEALRAAVLGTAPVAAPGSTAVYSDLGYMTLGWLVEAVSGAPLDQAFAAHRDRWRLGRDAGATTLGYRRRSRTAPADPADGELVATEIWPGRSVEGRALCGQVHDDNAAGLDGVAGHAGLFGSIADVAGWASAWLEATCDAAPTQRGATLLGSDPSIVGPWMRRLVATHAAPETTWRLGWDTPSRPISTAGSRASDRAFGHLGFVGTSVWVDPAREAAVVLLTNRVHPARSRVDAIRALRPALHDAIWDAIDGASRQR